MEGQAALSGAAIIYDRGKKTFFHFVYGGNIQIMINWVQISGFDWDAGNSRKSKEKHGVSQSEAEEIFFNRPLVLEDSRHSAAEPRYHALGMTDSHRYLHITFTLRAGETLIRVISARDMHRKERVIYEQAQYE